MICKKCTFPADQFPIPESALPEHALFFDIETTGLSPRNSHLYLIGAVFRDGGNWQFIQWFLQKPSEEKSLLEEFATCLQDFHTLIHYNGQTFDLPYLQHRYEFWQIPDPLSRDHSDGHSLHSMDLYRLLRPLKKLLNLNSMKQKDMERLISFPRKDQKDGKELINVYHQYLQSGAEQALEQLLLHNHDDVLGMLGIYQLYSSYIHLADHLTIENWQLQNNILSLQIIPETVCPISIDQCKDNIRISLTERQLLLRIEGCSGCFRHYYPNYKEYFYLPLEDTAIHKSVGIYVDPSCREKARADTCYTKKEGLFFPQPSPVFLPEFRQDRRKGTSWFSAEQLDACCEQELTDYASMLIRSLLGLS